MSGYAELKQKRIERPGHPRASVCGCCGNAVKRNELLCNDCLIVTVYVREQFNRQGDSN